VHPGFERLLLATETRFAGGCAFGTGGFSLLEPAIRDVTEVDHYDHPSDKKSTGVLAYPPPDDLKIMNFNKISILPMQVPAKFGF